MVLALLDGSQYSYVAIIEQRYYNYSLLNTNQIKLGERIYEMTEKYVQTL